MPIKKTDLSSSSKEGTEYSEEAYWENDPETVRRFLENLPAYEQLSSEVAFTIKEILEARTIEVASVLHRTKELKSFLGKIHRKTYEDPFCEIKDFSGIRVVCYYTDDLRKVSQIIRDHFQVIEEDDKTAASAIDRFGYGGLHFLVKLGDKLSGPRYDRLKELVCEIQLRTVMQDAWATVSHHLLYKQENDVPDVLKRGVNALAGALDSADYAFQTIRTEKDQYLKSVQASIHKDDLSEVFIDTDSLTAYLESKFIGRPIMPHSFLALVSEVKDNLTSMNILNLQQLDTLLDETNEARQYLKGKIGKSGGSNYDYSLAEVIRALGIAFPDLTPKYAMGKRLSSYYKEAREIFLHAKK